MKRWGQFVPMAPWWKRLQFLIALAWWYVEIRPIEKRIIEEREHHRWLHQEMENAHEKK